MRSVLAACLTLLVFPATASSMEYEAPSASISRGDPLTFAVRTTSSVTVRVSAGPDVGADGLLTGPDGTWLDERATQALPDLQVWSVPRGSLLRQRPGTYYWQAYAKGEPVGRVQKLTVRLPASDRGRGKLYPRFGRRGSTRFYLSSSDFPATVSGRRFKALARTTAARWGLKARRWTSAKAGVQDGFDVAGFASDVPDGVLGVQTDFIRNGTVVERDLALRTGENWAAGPAHPGLDQIDLESVLLHELGHMAGNKKHRARCVNSPLDEALAAGEWWRGPRDKWFGDCSGLAHASSVKRFAHRVIRVD